MKKSISKRLFATAMVVIISCAALIMPASAALPDNDIVSPQYIGVGSFDYSFTLKSGGALKCEGTTLAKSGYYAGVFVELQKKINGSWTTIETWSNADEYIALVEETYYADYGTYRLLLTHIAYNTNWQTVEYFYDYSNVITYN